MARRHAHKVRIVTKFVRIPGELPEGKGTGKASG